MIVNVDFKLSTDIRDACKEAQCFARHNDVTVRFKFNGVVFNVSAMSDIDELIQRFHSKSKVL